MLKITTVDPDSDRIFPVVEKEDEENGNGGDDPWGDDWHDFQDRNEEQENPDVPDEEEEEEEEDNWYDAEDGNDRVTTGTLGKIFMGLVITLIVIILKIDLAPENVPVSVVVIYENIPLFNFLILSFLSGLACLCESYREEVACFMILIEFGMVLYLLCHCLMKCLIQCVFRVKLIFLLAPLYLHLFGLHVAEFVFPLYIDVLIFLVVVKFKIQMLCITVGLKILDFLAILILILFPIQQILMRFLRFLLRRPILILLH